ncbi:MAG: hypothetical protein JWN62_1104 [Acidimicrobiales bacterium]|nr:hypothetical protein [Acidimicrobiales bacterium]
MRHLDTQPLELRRHFDALAGTVHDHQRGSLGDLAIAVPGGESGRRIVADDGEELGIRVLLGEDQQGVGGVARAAAIDLCAPGHQAFHVCDGGLDEVEPVFSGRDPAALLFLPGHVGHHQYHHIESQGMAHVDCGHEVTDVRGIERAAEQSDTSRHGFGV